MYVVTQSKKHCTKFKEKVNIPEDGYRSYVIKFYDLGSRISFMKRSRKKINHKTNDRTKKSEERPFCEQTLSHASLRTIFICTTWGLPVLFGIHIIESFQKLSLTMQVYGNFNFCPNSYLHLTHTKHWVNRRNAMLRVLNLSEIYNAEVSIPNRQ